MDLGRWAGGGLVFGDVFGWGGLAVGVVWAVWLSGQWRGSRSRGVRLGVLGDGGVGVGLVGEEFGDVVGEVDECPFAAGGGEAAAAEPAVPAVLFVGLPKTGSTV